jgi:hypothetical protein
MSFGTAATQAPLTVLYTISGTTATSTMTVHTTDGMNAFSVQLAYQASDLIPRSSTTSTSPVSSSVSSTGSNPTSSVSETASSVPSSPNTGEEGLGTPAKIAIGVAVPVVAIALIVIGLLLIRRRRAKARDNQAATDTQPVPVYEKYSTPPNELDSRMTISEAYGRRSPQELDGRGHPQELPANPR